MVYWRGLVVMSARAPLARVGGVRIAMGDALGDALRDNETSLRL